MMPSHFSRILLTAFLVGCLQLANAGPSRAADELSPYEQQLFTQSFEAEPLEKRLNRLETSLFGEQQGGTVADRKNRVLQILARAQKANPRPASLPEEQIEQTSTSYPGGQAYEPEPVKQPDATDYPTVTALEREVFGRDFIFDPIDTRLSRIEKKVFRATYEHIPLVDRVDKLLMRYPHVAGKGPDTYPRSAISSLPGDSSQLVGTRDTYTKVEALEQAFFDGRTFSEKLMTERLDQLEQKAFGHTYTGQSVEMRVARLIKGFEANKNTVASNSGVLSRPPVQSKPAYTNPNGTSVSSIGSSYTPNSTRPPQNIQIGSGFSQNSSYRFSPEMMEMLPDDVRSQMMGQSGQTTSSSSGTVIIERSTSYPGIQPFGSAPIQYRNYYTPNVNQSSQTTTTVIQPDGTASVYSYQNAPVYTGNPALLQNLGNLEINVFGQVNTVEPVPIRLGKLEQVLLGQAYPTYPEADRIAHLQKVYQYQSLGKLFGRGAAGDAGRQAGTMILGVPLSAPNNPAPVQVTPQTQISPTGVPMFRY